MLCCRMISKMLFQPTRPLRGATGMALFLPLRMIFQPTRPLRGATNNRQMIFALHFISTHAPLAGRDLCAATPRMGQSYFNPRAPCGARREGRRAQSEPKDFNPRAPCGARRHVIPSKILNLYFNPRAPCGARRRQVIRNVQRIHISTHAPLAGRDSKSVQITMHIFAITDKFQMLLHRMPPVRAFCSFLMQENHADFGCEPPK